MTDNLTPDQRNAREAARDSGGKFGEQQHTGPELELPGKRTVTMTASLEDGTPVPVEVPVFSPAYPVDPEWEPGETAVGYVDAVECACGNDTSGDGFGHAGADGRYSDLRANKRHPDLSDDLDFYMCHACGRVFHGKTTELAGDGGQVPVVAKYLDGPELGAARKLYWAAEEGDLDD